SDHTYADDLAAENSDDPSDSLEREYLRDAVRTVISDLPARDQAVMCTRFGLDGSGGATLEEVGRAFQITRERVRQIEVRTLSRLRHTSNSRSLRDYVDG
ncbi:MAG: sigma factor-like helix-turn-helix DNA-binding protein, partial [Ilumatobacteraceae bacterium]